jgi:hypothetical protein
MTPDNREALLTDLRLLLAFTHLGGWGMDSLRSILPRLLPELEHSTIEE